jgi:hypothetical protein
LTSATLPSRRALLEAIYELETMLGESARLGDENFADRRLDAIRLRKLIAEKIGLIGSLGETAFKDSASLAAFRNEFSAMRSATALHYASWPIVAISLDNRECVASLESLRASYRRFIGWVKSELEPTGNSGQAV